MVKLYLDLYATNVIYSKHKSARAVQGWLEITSMVSPRIVQHISTKKFEINKYLEVFWIWKIGDENWWWIERRGEVITI